MVRQAHHERLNLSRLKLVAGKLVKPANFVAHEFTYELILRLCWNVFSSCRLSIYEILEWVFDGQPFDMLTMLHIFAKKTVAT